MLQHLFEIVAVGVKDFDPHVRYRALYRVSENLTLFGRHFQPVHIDLSSPAARMIPGTARTTGVRMPRHQTHRQVTIHLNNNTP
jgi:hypothetical protein